MSGFPSALFHGFTYSTEYTLDPKPGKFFTCKHIFKNQAYSLHNVTGTVKKVDVTVSNEMTVKIVVSQLHCLYF